MRTSRTVVALATSLAALGYPLAAHSAAASRGVTFRSVVLADQKSYGEPSLALAPDGRHIAVCVPGGGGTKVWWSADRGRSFGTTATTSQNGGGDCELDFLPNGTLLNADLEVTDSNVKLSTDYGKTFDGGRPVGLEQDRQWFAHSADGQTVYLVYHDFAAEGEFFARSRDGGKTWPQSDAANPVNGADQATAPGTAATPAKPNGSASLLDQGGNTFSGPMLISPDGRYQYVLYSISDLGSNATSSTPPYGPTRGIVVAHRSTESASFTNTYAVTSQDGKAVNGAIFPWGSVDKAGNVYVFYNSDAGSPGHFHTYYVFSTDHGSNWSAPVRVDGAPLEQGAQIYSTGQAGAAGVIDLAWYGSDNASSPADKLATWKVHFAQVRNATSAHPSITRAVVSGMIHRGDICLNGLLCVAGGDRSLADFFELAIGRDGMASIAYSSNAVYGSHPSTALTAPVTHAVVHTGRVVFAQQTSGRSAWSK